jgi:hypothetical protein
MYTAYGFRSGIRVMESRYSEWADAMAFARRIAAVLRCSAFVADDNGNIWDA